MGTLSYISLFDRAARFSRHRTALVDDTGALTFGQVSASTNRLARALIARGFGPSTRVSTLSPNTSLAMISLLAGLRAGGAWCNVSFRSAPAVNMDILRRGGCEALFFHSSVAKAIPDLRRGVPTLRHVVCLDQDVDDIPSIATFTRDVTDDPILVELAPDAVAFQGSTGGTTGAPKITQGTQDFLAMNVLGFMTELTFAEREPPVNLAVAPITHAGGIVAMTTLAFGGTVVMMAVPDLGKLLDEVERHRVSLLFLPPTVIYALLNHPKVRTTELGSLRYLMSAAAPFAAEKIAAAHAVFGPIICQSYGQTESGFPLSFMSPADINDALANPAHAGRLRSVGRVSANVGALEIMSPTGELLPPGQVGEIVVRGPTVMTAYVDDPAATAAIKAHGWHHTGDLGSFDDDGYLYVSDRLRDLIISGGFNVFPLEVEQVLVAHAAVQDCAVIGIPDEKWGEAVKAVVELAPGRTVSEAELIALCKQKLGSVMAPKSVEFVEQLPRSAVGKVLKRELRRRYQQGPA